MNQKITIIIPVRITEQVHRAEERLHRLLATIPKNLFDVIVSDYGTPSKYRPILEALSEYDIEVVSRPGVEDQIFNPGQCRDYGAQRARTDLIMFNDLDFYANAAMYTNIHAEAAARDLLTDTYNFFCVPAFFLTEKGEALYLRQLKHGQAFNYQIHQLIYENQADFCLFPAYGSSAIVVNRRHYLALGGHNCVFSGHGAEDYDLLHRLAHYHPRAPKSVDYYQNTKSNAIDRFVGFRAFFALYGLDVFHRGLFMVHLWHPSRKMITGYYQTRRNFSLLEQTMRDFDRERLQPPPLDDLTQGGRQLVLLRQLNSAPAKALRQILPLRGSYELKEESSFPNGRALLDYLEAENIDCLGFLNPYGNKHRLSLYQTIKDSGRDFWVFDRGALPDSWFFDQGFNYDSPSYQPRAWDWPLSEAERAGVDAYMQNLRRSRVTLEKNGPRRQLKDLKAKYRVGGRKVLFIPCQRPDDSVITYFAGPVGDQAGFRDWTAYLAARLDPAKWLIIRKKHPLETQLPPMPNTVSAEPDTHVHDLLELADAVFLINSGVGLLGLAFEKPVICAGLAFYAHDGLARSVTGPEEALAAVIAAAPPEPEKVRRFLHHLQERVYSFGAASYKEAAATSGSVSHIVREIDFKYVNLLGRRHHFGSKSAQVNTDSFLFSSFGGPAGLQPPETERKTPAAGRRSVFVRKFRKLVTKPGLFFQDFLARNKKR